MPTDASTAASLAARQGKLQQRPEPSTDYPASLAINDREFEMFLLFYLAQMNQAVRDLGCWDVYKTKARSTLTTRKKKEWSKVMKLDVSATRVAKQQLTSLFVCRNSLML